MKGNAIVGQSGGPTAAINSSLAGVYTTAKERGAGKVFGMLHGIQGLLEEKYVDLSEHIKNDLDVELLKRTPSAYLGSCRYKLPEIFENEEIYQKIFDILDKLDVKYFFYIGGNDSMDTIKKLYDYSMVTGRGKDVSFIGVPKTIDNDLAVTDHTPGFGSAAKYIGTSVKEIIRDSKCIEYPNGLVTIVEIMGRNAGWLTGAAALSRGEDCKGPDMIFLPEIPFDMDFFMKKTQELLEREGSVVVCLSEGVKLKDGRYVCELSTEGVDYVDSFGHKQLTGTAAFLCSHVASELGCKTRSVEFSTLQRAGSHIASRVDIQEAFQVGGAAVKAADEGDNGKMVILKRVSDDPYQCSTDLYDVHKIANDEKVVPTEWIDVKNANVTEKFISYVKPLIQADVPAVMVDGIPRHLYNREL